MRGLHGRRNAPYSGLFSNLGVTLDGGTCTPPPGTLALGEGGRGRRADGGRGGWIGGESRYGVGGVGGQKKQEKQGEVAGTGAGEAGTAGGRREEGGGRGG